MIRWIVVTILKLVITIVCRVVGRLLRLVYELLRAFLLLGKSLVTWDKCVLQEALASYANYLISAFTSTYVVTDPIVELVQRERLRGYVDDELDARFTPEIADAMRAALRVRHGVFGLRAHLQRVPDVC